MAKITHARMPHIHEPEEVTRAAQYALDNRAKNNSDAIGELLDLLMEKGLIDEAEVKIVLGLV